MQGGTISPLLANVALHGMEELLVQREFGKAAWPTSAVTFGPPEVFGSLNWPT
jgi:retron-type reverse transcriptase